MPKMSVIFEKCKGCGLCTVYCPKKIVAIQKENRNSKGYFTSNCINDDACIGCSMCAIMCPECAIIVEK